MPKIKAITFVQQKRFLLFFLNFYFCIFQRAKKFTSERLKTIARSIARERSFQTRESKAAIARLQSYRNHSLARERLSTLANARRWLKQKKLLCFMYTLFYAKNYERFL